MATDGADRGRLRISVAPTSVVLLLAALALAVLVRNIVDKAAGTFSLFLVVAVLATLALGPVAWLSRYMARPLAIVAVLALSATLAGLVGWGVVGDVVDELDRLDQVAPRAAKQLSESSRFGDLAREVRLEERVDDAVRNLRKVATGQAEDAARRGGRVLVGTVLFIFLLSWGPRYASAGLRQIGDDERRRRVRLALVGSVRAGRAYLLVCVARALTTGPVVYLSARIAGVPAPAPLAIAVAVGSVVPLGILIGAGPLLLVAFGLSDLTTALVVAGLVVVLQIVDDVVVRPRLAERFLQVGTASSVVGLLVGGAVRGITGALVGLALVVFLLAAIEAAGSDDAPPEGAGSDAPAEVS